MKLNLLSQCTTLIKCIQQKTIGTSLLTNNYSIKPSDILLWKLTDPSVSEIEFRLLSPTTKILKDIDYSLTGSSNEGQIKVIIETSFDYINWTELKFKKDKNDKYLYVNTTNGLFNLTKKAYINDPSDPDYVDDLNLIYAFTKFNEFSKLTEDLYENYEFKFIRIRIVALSGTLGASVESPLRFVNLNITIDDVFDTNLIDTNLLELKSSIFTKPKIYEDQLFFPDMIKTYLKMLEENVSPLKHFNKSNIDIVVYDEDEIIQDFKVHGVGVDILEIDLRVY